MESPCNSCEHSYKLVLKGWLDKRRVITFCEIFGRLKKKPQYHFHCSGFEQEDRIDEA